MNVFTLRLFTVFFILFSSTTFAQKTAAISGKIISIENQPIENAMVTLKNTGFNTQTDKNGNYVIKNIPYGNYILVAFAYGKELIEKQVSIQNEKIEENFSLKELSKNLDEVIVQAEREKTFGITRLYSVENFGIYEGKKTEVIVFKDITANLSTNNPRQVYSKITGLNIWESDGVGLQLGIGGRGLSPNRTSNFNTRQNGYDISADALGYPESYYTPPTEALERIEIIRGAASLQFGTQFGGMLNFRFKKGAASKKIELTSRQSAGSWGFFGSFNSVGGTLLKGKLNYYAYYQHKTGSGYRPHSGFNYDNGFASFTYQVTPKLSVNVDLTKMVYLAQQAGGLTDKNFEDNPRQSRRARNWFKVDWNLFALTATYKFSEKTQLNVRNFLLLAERQSVGNLDYIVSDDDTSKNRTLIKGQFRNFGNETRLLHHYSLFGQQHTFLTGFRLYKGNSTAQQGDANNGAGADFNFLHPDNLENSDYSFPNDNESFFIENIFNFSPKFSLTPGLRFENINTFSNGHYRNILRDLAGNVVSDTTKYENLSRKRHFVIFGLGMSYKPNDKMEVYGNISQNYRAINFTDLRIVNPNFKVDPNIQDEKGYTSDFGVRGNLEEAFTYEATIFYMAYKGRIGQVLRKDEPPLYNDYRFRGNISDARNIGIEMFGEADIFRVFGAKKQNLKWSVFGNFAWIDARYIHTNDASIKNKKVEMVPPVTLKTGTTLKYKKFSTTLQLSYTGQQFSDATNSVYSATAIEGVIPHYKVVDLSARYSWRFLTLEASCNNMLNEMYFTRRAETYPGPGIIPSDGRGFYFTLQGNF